LCLPTTRATASRNRLSGSGRGTLYVFGAPERPAFSDLTSPNGSPSQSSMSRLAGMRRSRLDGRTRQPERSEQRTWPVYRGSVVNLPAILNELLRARATPHSSHKSGFIVGPLHVWTGFLPSVQLSETQDPVIAATNAR